MSAMIERIQPDGPLARAVAKHHGVEAWFTDHVNLDDLTEVAIHYARICSYVKKKAVAYHPDWTPPACSEATLDAFTLARRVATNSILAKDALDKEPYAYVLACLEEDQAADKYENLVEKKRADWLKNK